MISRRRFISGAAVLVAGGATGAFAVERRPDILNRIGLQDSPDIPITASGISVAAGSFDSIYMDRSVGWRVAIPTSKPIATVFCLHGRGGNSSTTFDSLRLHDVVAAEGLPLAIASVDGGDSNYWHRRQDGTDAMAMLTEEFVPMIQEQTKTHKAAVLGWSMGGYGAMLATQRHPKVFSAVAAWSPALWTKAGDAASGAFDSSEDFEEHDVFDARKVFETVPLTLSCGRGDPFYKASKAFAQGLPAKADVNFGDGFHDDSYWRSVSPHSLRFIARAVQQ